MSDGHPDVSVSDADMALIASAPDLYEIAAEAPVLSKYHGQHGFEVERFIADYETWMARRRAVMARARGEPHPAASPPPARQDGGER